MGHRSCLQGSGACREEKWRSDRTGILAVGKGVSPGSRGWVFHVNWGSMAIGCRHIVHWLRAHLRLWHSESSACSLIATRRLALCG